MIGELDIAGVFISPLLLCMVLGFAMRAGISWLMERHDLYKFVWQRPLFDTSLFFILTGAAFLGLHLATS